MQKTELKMGIFSLEEPFLLIRSDFVKTKRLKEKFAREPRANFTEFEMFRPLQEVIL